MFGVSCNHDMKQKQSFEEWKRQVDNILSDRTGMSSDDLPDSPYRDWYDDGVKPSGAASRAIKNARES